MTDRALVERVAAMMLQEDEYDPNCECEDCGDAAQIAERIVAEVQRASAERLRETAHRKRELMAKTEQQRTRLHLLTESNALYQAAEDLEAAALLDREVK